MIKEFQDYINSCSDDVKADLIKLYETVYSTVPYASEKISYKMLCFYIEGKFLCGFGVFKKHIGFYPGGYINNRLSEDLAARLQSYNVDKKTVGTIRLPYGKPIDFELISDIIAAKLNKT